MTLSFEPIGLNKQNSYTKHLAKCSQKASDYSFVNLWGWAEEYGLFWAWKDGFVWIKQTIPEAVYWAPVGKWEEAPWDRWLQDYFARPAVFIRIPEDLHLHWGKALGNRIISEEARDHWDYLYHVDDLITLRGNRFHKKKNLLNQFLKKYQSEYILLDGQVTKKAMAMQEDWCTWRDCESSDSLSAENRAIARILSAWEKLTTVTGAAIYKGVYQAINQIFLERSGSRHDIVNREQDLGDEGLRKAKQSYHPFDFIKKYRITVK